MLMIADIIGFVLVDRDIIIVGCVGVGYIDYPGIVLDNMIATATVDKMALIMRWRFQ